MNEPEIVVDHRTELDYLLTEAAEIEHGLMCCYLYAAFSLKDGERDGLSGEEAEATARFRATIVDIAREEMVHLALVCNLMSAIGTAPHWGRSNFPVSPLYHPAGIVVSLAPFDVATLDHFLFLERPEGTDIPDGAGFESEQEYERVLTRGRLVASAQDYRTVGHLYRAIKNGFVALAEKYGENSFFCGDPRVQVGPDLITLPGLIAVTDLRSAVQAIETIVTQGEGSPAHHETSHFQRFLKVREELVRLQAKNPSFRPAHPAARNPVMRRPTSFENRVWVTREPAASLLDLANAIYAMMLASLDLLFSCPTEDSELRSTIVDATLLPMHILAQASSYLPRLPATDDDDGPRAGMTFTMSRGEGHSVPDAQRTLARLSERATLIGEAYDRVAVPLDPKFAGARDRVKDLATRLAKLASRPLPAPAAAAPKSVPPPNEPSAVPASIAAGPADSASAEPGVEVVPGKHLVIRFDAKRCIHSRHCVLETPEVFLANVKGPWIHPDLAPIDRLVHVARTCPSGAITYERLDGGEPEDAPPVNLVRTRERGPLAFLADLHVEGQKPRYRATLCRCGASKNKPFCDGSHVTIGFAASGEPDTTPTDPLPVRGGPLVVTPLENGPLGVRGPLEVITGTGRTVRRTNGAKLCRCGGSANKPFCDGTHAKIGFQADGSDY